MIRRKTTGWGFSFHPDDVLSVQPPVHLPLQSSLSGPLKILQSSLSGPLTILQSSLSGPLTILQSSLSGPLTVLESSLTGPICLEFLSRNILYRSPPGFYRPLLSCLAVHCTLWKHPVMLTRYFSLNPQFLANYWLKNCWCPLIFNEYWG